MQKHGLVHIYTGNGKGKTTAAAGLAVRALSHGFKVGWVSFHKDPGGQLSGEIRVLKKLGVLVHCFAKDYPLCKTSSLHKGKKQLKAECTKGLKAIHVLFDKKRLDLLILDEINICVRDGFLKEEVVLQLMHEKPENIELIMTGRGATKKMIKQADLVSYIKEIKHPYKKGVLARKGIEY
ncbi:MAG: cob(I)yrinic acid a,c-diamide adenosyltransferase [Candidatus Omnitrophota bacterium]